MPKLTKTEFKEWLAQFPAEKQKAILRKLRERRENRSQDQSEKALTDEDSEAAAEKAISDVFQLSDLLQGKTKQDADKLRRGISLFDVYKGMRALAQLALVTHKRVQEMYKAGVRQRPLAKKLMPDIEEVTAVDPHKLYDFVKSIPGAWTCKEAKCWQCPFHKGRGIPTQNQLCADQYTKEALKFNRKVELAEQIPFTVQQLRDMGRKEHVALLGMLGTTVFKLKSQSKTAIIDYIYKNQKRKRKAILKEFGAMIEIPELLVEEESGEEE